MAITKDKKHEIVAELVDNLTSSKMTVVAAYQGLTVKQMQALRKQARENGTTIMVVKNRLVIKALQKVDTLKEADTAALKGMLVYAFNQDDEVAPAQVLSTFAKTNPNLAFVGAFSADGSFIDATNVQALANLPSKNQLIAGIINTLNSPVNGVMGGLKGNLHGLLQAIEAKAS